MAFGHMCGLVTAGISKIDEDQEKKKEVMLQLDVYHSARHARWSDRIG